MKLRFLVAQNFLMQVLGRFISSLSTFLITIFLARNYGATGYGDFTKMSVYISVFYLLIDFGMNAAVLKKIHDKKEQKEALFSSLIILRSLFAALLIFISLSLLSFLPFNPWKNEGFSPLVRFGIILLAPTIFTQGLVTSFNAIFQDALRYEQATLSILVGSAVTLLSVYLLGQSSAPLPLTAFSFVLGGIASVVVAYFLCRKILSLHLNFTALNRPLLKGILLSSLPLGITLLFNTIHFRADIFVLTVTRPTIEVGIYGLATKFFEFALAIPTFFMNAVYPLLLTSLHNNDKKQWSRMIRESALFLLSFSLLIVVGGYLSAPFLVYIKEEFIASVLPFRILIFALPLFFLSSLFMWILIAQGKTWRLVWIYGIAMLVNVGLNALFTPQFGYTAAAAITGVSEGVVLFLLGWNLRPLKLSS